MFNVSDFSESDSTPACGLNQVSSANTPDQSPAIGSRPRKPIFVWLKLLLVAPSTDSWPFIRMVLVLPGV